MIQTEIGNIMSTVKVGAKGQIVIPKEIRDMFGIVPGQQLIIMADKQRGIALQQTEVLTRIADAVFAGKGREVLPNEDPKGLRFYAEAIRKTIETGEDKK